MKKNKRHVSSRCRVLYRLSNIYKFFLLETFISFFITILLKFFKKILNRRLFHSVQSSLIYFVWDFQKGSRSKSVANSVNLCRILIASSTSFRDDGDNGSLGTSSSSLLPCSSVLTSCEGIRQNQRAHLHLGFQGLSPSLASRLSSTLTRLQHCRPHHPPSL